ncbi:MAG: aminomethyl-transferring glycine dehydrogenase subunit GcvPB [Caldilineales bacterium]|nr:aminomethyl-transferring glycine dehydrogenase subunit GcvPB [Caldilineales bacterium]
MSEPFIYDLGSPGRTGVDMPPADVPLTDLPAGFLRQDLPLPEMSELEVVRHYVRLSQLNYAVDKGFYPLGSCTMKYNPKVNERMARLPGLADIHPLQDPATVQGAMQMMYELQQMLAEISGLDAVTLQPAAGAHGELTGVLIMRNAQIARGQGHRNKILVPDSAHGTNPATTTMSGLEVIELPSGPDGNVDVEALRGELDDHVVGLMITNPNTLGLFEQNIVEICEMVHEAGGLVYGDGANLNAIMGIVRPGDLGIDVLHFNLHKTFSTPHGGGGPGSGPVGVVAELAPFLPAPVVGLSEEGDFVWDWPEQSIGRVRAFNGNFGMHVRAYTYIRMHGAEGLRRVSEDAVLNANYIQALLKQRDDYPIPHGDRFCMHELVAQGKIAGAESVHTLDIAKRLIDYGYHPPTVYFPLIVPEALMIEPTETESKDTLDAFVDALTDIAREARSDPELLHSAPQTAPVRRLDEVRAARQPVLARHPEAVSG